jgi:hypothetical protein
MLGQLNDGSGWIVINQPVPLHAALRTPLRTHCTGPRTRTAFLTSPLPTAQAGRHGDVSGVKKPVIGRAAAAMFNVDRNMASVQETLFLTTIPTH